MQLLATQPSRSAAGLRRTVRLPVVVHRPALFEVEPRSSRHEVSVREHDGLPDVDFWATKLVQVIAEVMGGDRPVGQLIRWTDGTVYAELDQRVRSLALTTSASRRHATARASVQSVHVSVVAEEVAEVAAHVRHNGCSRALAVRLEIHRGRWICTALTLG